MSRRVRWVGAFWLGLIGAPLARAQIPPRDSIAPAPAPAAARIDPVVERARQLVNEGRGAEGRAMMDTLVRALEPRSPALAGALLNRSMLSATAEGAERDLRRVIVEFPLTPPAETALVRLAQLEMQRGERASALAHLQRAEIEYTTTGARARAAYWAGRIHRDAGDEAKACEAFARARQWAPPAEVELLNQIDYVGKRCPTLPTPGVASVPAPSAVPPPPVTAPVLLPPPPADTSRPVSTQPPATVATAADTAARPVAPAPAPAATGGRVYSVQVAAFSARADAERLMGSFVAAGIEARVDGTVAPFRVRIGRYATRGEASRVAEDFRKRGQAAFVVSVP